MSVDEVKAAVRDIVSPFENGKTNFKVPAPSNHYGDRYTSHDWMSLTAQKMVKMNTVLNSAIKSK